MKDSQLHVLLLGGGGGREHAMVLAIKDSPKLERLSVTPGNAGTTEYNIDLDHENHQAVVEFCTSEGVDLVIVGPESPLVAGIADALSEAGIACFGPTKAAAQLEGSKTFARSFAEKYDIAGPVCESFTDVDNALAWLETLDKPVVVKADGLASGKGVIVPESRVETERAIYDFLADKTMGQAGERILIEERLVGEELSLFGIADGKTIVPLVTAQDHKRVGEGNTGLNTGGMGAFAPVPGIEADVEAELVEKFLTPVVEGMAAEGTPYIGVVYAGIMLTADGPRLIEYNCRFGDPEAQVILPLIESDVLELLCAAVAGKLDDVKVQVKQDTTAAVVVVAAQGYPVAPRKNIPIPDYSLVENSHVVLAGVRAEDDELRSSGGRVLGVVGHGDDLAAALANAYPVVDQLVSSDGLFARSDIGWRHAPRDAYAKAGVSLEAGAEVNKRIAESVKSTHDERVVSGLGSFGGVFDISSLSKYERPLLVASTDGVGTKTILAEKLDRWEGCGADIVNHGINDVLVQGAEPLFFLDTVAAAHLEPEVVGRIVDGMAEACRENDCVLLGGETAEMPGVLTAGSVDIAGTMVGAVDQSKLLPREGIRPGHVLIGMASSGLHTNGYSLARRVFQDMDLNDQLPGGAEGVSVGDALLATHRSYLKPLSAVLEANLVDGLAHITGGGIIDNLPRILPDGCGAAVDPLTWERPVLFSYLVSRGGLGMREAHQILNMGIGMVLVVAPEKQEEVQAALDEPSWLIGQVIAGSGVNLA